MAADQLCLRNGTSEADKILDCTLYNESSPTTRDFIALDLQTKRNEKQPNLLVQFQFYQSLPSSSTPAMPSDIGHVVCSDA